MNVNMKRRNSAIEILRITATFMILVSHYSFHGFFTDGSGYIAIANVFNRFLLQVSNLGNLAVDIFVMISGYCMINSQFKIRKLISLIAQVWFYSILIFIINCILHLNPITPKLVIQSLFPTTFVRYWFFTIYIVLYILSSFINSALKACRELRTGILKMLWIMLILWSILPTFTTASFGGTSEVVQFIMFYCIGAYMRLYPDNFISKNSGKIVCVMSAAWLATAVICDVLGIWIPAFAIHVTYFYSRTSVLTIPLSAALVAWHGKMKEFHSHVINHVASNVFAAYLLTDNELMRKFIWQDLFHCAKFTESSWLIVHMICTVLLLFAVGTLIEDVRKATFGKALGKAIDFYGPRMKKKLNAKIKPFVLRLSAGAKIRKE